MPQKEGQIEVDDLSQGLYDQANGLLITESHATEIQNVNISKLSIDEAYGIRRLHAYRGRHGGVRFQPASHRNSTVGMSRWKGAYAFAPVTERLKVAPQCVEAHFRLEEQVMFPESGSAGVARTYSGLTGRYSNTVGLQRTGGEHQFFPLVARGAREIEHPAWMLGIGIARPTGFQSGGTNASQPDTIVPMFAWFDVNQQRTRVSIASGIYIVPGVDTHIAVVCSAASQTFYVNGVAYAADTTHGFSALPTTMPSAEYPVYFGRCFTREPGVYYDAASSYDRKNLYLGKHGISPTAVALHTITMAGSQLATVSGTANSYVGYRVRVVTGPSAGKIMQITAVANPTNDGTIAFTLDDGAGHGILVGNVVDIITPLEPVTVDCTLQEVRLWATAPTSTTILQLTKTQAFSVENSVYAHENPLGNASIGNSSSINLIAYWPFDDDGGIMCAEKIGGSDAYFGPSFVGKTVKDGSPIVWLDGETQGLAVKLSDDPNFKRNYAFNLGRSNEYYNAWNFCARMHFCIGANHDTENGVTPSQQLYQTLFSIGNPTTGVTALECRLFRNVATSKPRIVFILPDGTSQTLSYDLDVGRWHNAIIGVENVQDGGSNTKQHYAYVVVMDADMAPLGAITAAFNIDKREIDTEHDAMLQFGASVVGTDNKGVGRANHALIGIAALGYGFHPAHIIGAVPTTALSTLNEFIPFDPIEERAECVPAITGPDGGASMSQGSPNITLAATDEIPPNIIRWPTEMQQITVTQRKVGELDVEYPDHNLVESISGTTVKAIRALSGAGVAGTECRIVVWSGYTEFATAEPAWDTDVNTGRKAGWNWAFTEDLFTDIVGGAAGFDLITDPIYEFASPFRIGPRWHEGIVDRLDAPIRALMGFKKSDDTQEMLAVVGGSLYVQDERWRRGGPFDDEDYAFELLRGPAIEKQTDEDKHRGYKLFSQNYPTLRRECIRVDVPPHRVYNGTNDNFQYEIDVWLDTVDGRRTLMSLGMVVPYAVAGSTAYRAQKAVHWYVNNGDLVLEIADEMLGTGSYSLKTVGQRVVKPGRWNRLQVEFHVTAGTCCFKVNGRAVTTTATGAISAALLANASLPFSQPRMYLGAFGCEVGLTSQEAQWSDGLGGKIGAFQAFRGFKYGSSGGVGLEYTPAKIAAIYPASDDRFTLALDDGMGYCPVVQDLWFATKNAAYLGYGLKHAGSGMGVGDSAPSIEVFGDVAYITTGASRPWRYDMKELTAAGIRPPAGNPVAITVSRQPLRIKTIGADLPATVANTSRGDLNAASPNLRTFVGTAPLPNAAEIGDLVWIPAHPAMGAAGDYPGDYIGIVRDISTAAPVGYRLDPPPFAEQLTAASDLPWQIHRAGRRSDLVGTSTAFKAVINGMPRSTTPWGDRRLLPLGKDDNNTPLKEDFATRASLAGCFHFRGNQYWETPGITALDGFPIASGKVLDIKGYVKLDDVSVYGDDEMVISEQAVNGSTAAYRISIIDGGRLKFEFFDVKIGAYRSIKTTGKVITAGQWFYVRVRYRFKDAGSSSFDSLGGWEPDQRWQYRGASAYQKSMNYRDGIWVYACEGLHQFNSGDYGASAGVSYEGDVEEAAPCGILTVPGSHSPVGDLRNETQQSRANHSMMLMNGGLLKSAPFLSPERGDALFPAAGASAAVNSGLTVTLTLNTIQGIAAGANISNAVQFTLPAGFVLPRTVSMNRDDAWNRNMADGLLGTASSQIMLRAGAPTQNYYNSTMPAGANVGYTPNLLAPFSAIGGASSYGKAQAWAVLLRVWTIVTTGGGAGVVGGQVDKATADAARVLAIVHLGNNDLGINSTGGVSGHTVFVTDDVIFGGDGLGSLKYGAVALTAGATLHCTIELMNGSNQSVNSTNRLVVPSLLEQGDNPVGVSDSPDQSIAPIRFGGTRDQGSEGRVRSGLRGYMATWGLAVNALATSAANVYTTDMMPPDAFFTGPCDTRFQSLPRLAWINSANILDVASGAVATRSSIVYNFEVTQGNIMGPDTGSSSTQTPPSANLVRDGSTAATKGDHRFRITYYDPRQIIDSSPGEEILVRIDNANNEGDDQDAETYFTITGLPISGDARRGIARRIWKTLADGAVPFLLYEVADNTTTGLTAKVDDIRLSVSQPLAFDNGRPPVCRALCASESNLLYAGIDDAPNVVAISKAYTPELVPGTFIVYGESGKGGGIIALGFIRGVILPAKRNALFAAYPVDDVFKINRIGQETGILSHQSIAELDSQLYFPSQRAVSTFSGNLRAYSASDIIQNFYRSRLNARALSKSCGVVYHDRQQYLLAAVPSGVLTSIVLGGDRRFDQFGNQFHAWTIYDHGAKIDSATEYDDPTRESQVVAVGANGYVGAWDEENVTLATDGSRFIVGGVEMSERDWCVGTVDASATDTTLNFVISSSSPLYVGDNYGGVPFIIVDELDVSGASVGFGLGVRWSLLATGIFARGLVTQLAGNWSQYAGKIIVVGGYTTAWKSKWFTIDHPARSVWDHIDLYFDKVAGGVAYLEVFIEFNTTPAVYRKIALDSGEFKIPVSNLRAGHVQVRVSTYGARRGFVLHRMDLRGVAQTSGKRQRE